MPRSTRSLHVSRASTTRRSLGTKAHVDRATLPADDELAAALPDFFGAFGRPGPQARQAKLAALGLNTDGDLERNLGRRVVEASPDVAG